MFAIDNGSAGGTIPPIGSLTLTADSVMKINDSTWQLSGNVRINNLLRCTGTVTANQSTWMVSGTGEIFIEGLPAPLPSSIEVYSGSWEFNGKQAVTQIMKEVTSGLKLVGLNVNVSHVEIIPYGVRLQGTLKMPASLGGGTLAVMGSDYIQLTTTNGLEFSGVTWNVPNAKGLQLAGVPFNATDVKLHVSADEVQIRGKLKLPATLGGTLIDLSTAGNHLAVRDDNYDGIPELEVVGSVRIDGPVVIGPGFSLEDMLFVLDTSDENLLKCNGILNVPAGFGINVGIGFREGYFNYVHAGVAHMNKPVLYTPTVPPVPIVFWQDADAWIDELAPGPPPIILGGHMAFTAGPQVGEHYLLRLDGTAEYNTAGRFTGTLLVQMGGGDDPFELASAVIIVDKVYGVYVKGHLTFIGVLDVDGALRVDLHNNLQGKLVGNIHAPSWLGGGTLADATVYAQFYDDGPDSNDYFIATGRVGWIFDWEHAVLFDLHTGAIDWNADMDLVGEFPEPPPPLGGSGLRALNDERGTYTFALPAGLEGTIFEIDWDENDTDLNLVRPDSTRITPATVGSYPDVKYFKNLEGHKTFFAVVAPEAGDWTVEVTNPNGIGGYVVRALKKTTSPAIAILQPAADTNGGTVTITWTDADSDSDARIDLFYDSDRDGADGVQIVSGLSEDDPADSYVWDTTGAPAGAYYVYAKIDDGKNVPVISYSVGRVIVTDPAAPPAPSGLSATAGAQAGQITLSWAASAGAVDHYEVKLTADAAGEVYVTTADAGSETKLLLTNLIVGYRYRATVVAVGPSGNRSVDASPILFTVAGQANSSPAFAGGLPGRATVGVPYRGQVAAFDLDWHTVAYALANAPAGMTISPSGLVQWTPTGDEAGTQTFSVLLDDGHGDATQRELRVLVAASGTTGRAPEIYSEAPPQAAPGGEYSYQVLAADADAGATLTYQLLVSPSGASVGLTGIVQWPVSAPSGWYEFLVKVADETGLFTLQRFYVLIDTAPPSLPTGAWGELTATGVNSIEATADPMPDASGPVQYRFEVDGAAQAWQDSPTIAVAGLLPNTAHALRVMGRDQALSIGPQETAWSDPLTTYTLAEPPPAPSFVTSDLNSISVELTAGGNPTDTKLALFNVSTNQWIATSGQPAVEPAWADAAAWSTVQIADLAVDTMYFFQVKTRNAESVESDFGPLLEARTLAPDSRAAITANREWIYGTPPGARPSLIRLQASYENDPFANSAYSYVWDAHHNVETGESLVLVAGGGSEDDWATYSAPGEPSDPLLYGVACTITGNDNGNSVSGWLSVEVRPFVQSDLDQDADADLADFLLFQACFNGPNRAPKADCAVDADLDGDTDVDLADFLEFQKCFNGPNRPAKCQ